MKYIATMNGMSRLVIFPITFFSITASWAVALPVTCGPSAEGFVATVVPLDRWHDASRYQTG